MSHTPFFRPAPVVWRPKPHKWQQLSRRLKTVLIVLGIVALLVLGARIAEAAPDRDLMITANAMLLIDWGQTRDMSKRPEYSELNPILGRNPSQGKVDRYFLTSLAVSNLLAYTLPTKWANRYLKGIAQFQLAVVDRNARLGVEVNF